MQIMRRLAALASIVSLAAASCSIPDNPDNEEQSGGGFAYAGLETPGATPELFAPGLVSTDDLEALPAFSPDLREFYFLRQREDGPPGYRVIRNVDGKWNEEPAETTEGSGEVFISPDGRIMHLGSEYRERTANGWSALKSLGPAFEEYEIMRLTASATGTYVFDERNEAGLIRYSRLVDGERETPVPFGAEINQGTFTAHPFIAPDESYLIFDSKRENGYGDSDLYISFRDEDGNWSAAINMGTAVNTEFEDIFGSVTSDGKYFVYTTINLEEPSASVFWVDAGFIERLRP